MNRLDLAQKKVLQALKSLSRDGAGSVSASQVVENTGIGFEDVMDLLMVLYDKEYADVFMCGKDLSSTITKRGCFALRQELRFESLGRCSGNRLSPLLHAKASFLQSLVLAKEYEGVALTLDPCSEYLDPTDTDECATVSVHLWLPQPTHFSTSALRSTTVVAICGIVSPELKSRMSNLEALNLDKFYNFKPSKLIDAKIGEFSGLIGQLLGGAFILAASVPWPLVGGLNEPRLSYQTLLDFVLLPLATMHSRLIFKCFSLRISSVGEYSDGVLAYSKKILKLKNLKFNVSIVEPDLNAVDRFCFYACKFISYGVSRKLDPNPPDDTWVSLLSESLRGTFPMESPPEKGGPPEAGGPSE